MSIPYLQLNRPPTTFLHLDNVPVKYDNLNDLLKLEIDLPEGVILGSILEEIPLQLHDQFLTLIISKLPQNAPIFISGTDLYEASRILTCEDMSMDHYNQLVLNGRYSCVSLSYLKEKLSSMGVQINSAKLGGLGQTQYFLVGIRM